jgi:GTP cyclohydrolase II
MSCALHAAALPGAPAPAVDHVLRSVHRAVAEIRRGVPVLLSGASPLVVVPAETAGASSAADFAALAESAGWLLLAPPRAAAVLRRPIENAPPAIALRVGDWAADIVRLRALADPTLEQMLGEPLERDAAPSLAAAALALAKLARLLPAVVAAPAGPDAAAKARELNLLTVEAADVLSYPAEAAAELRRVAEADVPLLHARDCRVVAFRAPDMGIEHLAIVIGSPGRLGRRDEAPLVRIHSECFTGDLLGSLRCDCGAQLQGAIQRMGQEGSGVLLYLSQEGRGIGLVNKLRAYAMQDRGLDTLDANRALGWGADERNFLIAATMLRELGVERVRLLTNNPDKIAALSACGIEVAGRVSHLYAPNGLNDRYLETKIRRFGHLAE